jgi:hypothetical protein
MEMEAVGSKSEREAPVLTSLGKKIRVFLLGDNPFSNQKVRALVGKTITAKGTWKRGTFRIDEYEAQPFEVVESQDPAEVLEEASEEITEDSVTEEEDEETNNVKEDLIQNTLSGEKRESDE